LKLIEGSGRKRERERGREAIMKDKNVSEYVFNASLKKI
jgi:hypothetical protein